MTFRKSIRTTFAAGTMLVVAAAATTLTKATAPRFFPDDPIWVERDTEDASTMQPHEVSLFVDVVSNMARGTSTGVIGPARNVNTVDEVPDSSWFTNRAGRRALTPDDVFTGPDTDNGPAAGPWTIASSKSDGVTPGFTIKDSNGQRWFLKFDPPGYRAMATGTEVTVTKLMWALGYNVPENHIAYLRREQLVVGPGAKFTLPGGRTRAMEPGDVNRLLERASREADGSYRIVASKALPGKPIGRIRFSDMRPDDPNDTVPHEDRRELRAYGVFAAWLNHVDAKQINSLDTLVTENGRSYVRHNLLDFGSALGSGGIGPADYWEGAEYLVEPHSVGKQMIGFGFVYPKWHTAPYYEAPAIGRLPENNAALDPEAWRPRVPNPAFLHARADDKFWAARKLMALATPLLRAAVKAGQFGNPEAEEFLVRALAERRDAILRAYLPATNPIAEPVLRDGVLRFRNAAVDADVAHTPDAYRATWFAFDNATSSTTPIGETFNRTPRVGAPNGLPHSEGSFVKVEVSAEGASYPSWASPVDVYFRLGSDGWQLVGFARMPERQ